MKKYKWKEAYFNDHFYYYNLGTGRIQGEVSRLGHDKWVATSHVDSINPINLGSFIDEDFSKTAIEEHQKWYDETIEDQAE